MKNQVFKYVLKVNGEVAGYFMDLDALHAYVEYIEGEIDYGNVDASEVEGWEIKRFETKLPSGQWYELGFVDGICKGCVPGDEGTSIDLGFILARCNDDADFRSYVVLAN